MGVATSSLDFEYTLVYGEDCDIERTTTKIENQNILGLLNLLCYNTIGHGCRSRLIQDPYWIKSSDLSCLLVALR